MIAAYGLAYKYQKLSDKIGDVERDYSSHVTEFIAGMKTIQVFHNEEYEKV